MRAALIFFLTRAAVRDTMVLWIKRLKGRENMVRHVILWTLRSDLTEEEKDSVRKSAKKELEGLCGVVPSIVSITVHVDPLPSSNCDMMLDSSFEDEEGLKAYASHPAHVAVANKYVRPYTANRVCMDFSE